MSAFDYQLSTITKYRAGTADDPYVDFTQSSKVINQKIVMNEIPVFLNKVVISGMTEKYQNDDSDLGALDYRVDYTEGFIYFHSSQEGTTKTLSAKGRGNHFISQNRIYISQLNGEVTTVLSDITDKADNFKYIDIYDNATVYKKFNIVRYQGSTYMYISSTSASGNSPTNNTYWTKIAGATNRGTYSTSTTYTAGDVVQDSLNQKVYQSLIDGNLNQPLTDTTKWQPMIDVSSIVTTLNTTNTNIQAAEAIRVTSENSRISSESTRSTNETNRQTSETTRQNQETTRQSQETTRQSNETTRQTAETVRIARDASFVYLQDYNNSTVYVVNNQVTYNGVTYICILNSTGNLPTNATYWKIFAASGAVTNVSSANSDMTVANGSVAPVLTLNSGTGANQIPKRDGNGNLNNIGNQITNLSTNTTLTYAQSGIINVTTGSSTITITLPTATTSQIVYTIKKVDSGTGTVSIATTSSQTIDGVMTKTLTNQYANITVVSDGSNWNVKVHNDKDDIVALKAEIAQRAINVKYPPAPLVAAVGDGITDDTAAIRAILNSAYNTVIVPAGNYKITDQIDINSGSVKKVIGNNGAILSVTYTTGKILFNLYNNVAFENLKIDFNNGSLKYGFLFRENLGEINLKNIEVVNVKDKDNSYMTVPFYIMSAGNQLAIDGIKIENILKYSTNTDDAGFVNGSLEGVYVTTDATSTIIDGGYIKNVRIKEFHNIDLSDVITSVASNGIYIASGTSTNKSSNVVIENVYGYNFGKRLIKTQVGSIQIRNVIAESYSNDCLVAIGTQDYDDVLISNVTLRGKMRFGITPSSTNTIINNVDIVITGATIYSANSFGIGIIGDNITVNNARIDATFGIVNNKTFGTGAIKNTRITNTSITLNGTAASGIEWLQGFEAFDGFTIDNVTITRNNSALYAIDFLQTGVSNKNLTITNLTLIDNFSGSQSLYGVSISLVTGVSVHNFVHINNGTGSGFRSLVVKNSSRVRIKNTDFSALMQSGVTAGQIDTCTDVYVDGIIGNPSTSYWISVTLSNVKLNDTLRSKVIFNDATSRNTSSFVQEFTADTTANRPTSTVTGQQHFDTTINKPVWWNGSSWMEHGRYVAVPATATSTGTPGDWSADASFFYVCHATNTWKRVAISAW